MKLPKLSTLWGDIKLIDALTEWARQIDAAEKLNRKSNADVELSGDKRLILTDTSTGTRYVVAPVAGVLTITAL